MSSPPQVVKPETPTFSGKSCRAANENPASFRLGKKAEEDDRHDDNGHTCRNQTIGCTIASIRPYPDALGGF
ncbi:hypothetical protein Fuma_01761 [Fuerstiella marisgermanici]|uniref:Uncharacterized protein n=1 Tax=Fuerstiella marisgermanici TaxID=1891926 RepID=A0A1P8WDN6_9PLAN|nr:hypothetical protein Fuma_01761 [Fuerstiella marisgermanici]